MTPGRTLGLLFALVCCACMNNNLVPCGDLVCPADAVCVAGSRCAYQDQLDACSGIEDGALCNLPRGMGRCDLGVCVAVGCGNNVVDPGELCDDGNQTSGDGCRADCAKEEVCNDGIVDEGERCDDGNNNPADGCDACAPNRWTASVLGLGIIDPAQTPVQPSALSLDVFGNLYIADSGNHVIRKLSTSGTVTIVAGTAGSAGFTGDGGLATSAYLSSPSGVVVDGSGVLYVSDTGNHRIRRVDSRGVITTIAGTGVAGLSGDFSTAVTATLWYPTQLAIDGLGTLWVTDSWNNRIRRIDPLGFIFSVPTVNFLQQPQGVAVGPGGEIYVAEFDGNVIKRFDTSGETTLAISVRQPRGLAIGPDGSLYVADSLNHRVVRRAPDGTVTTIAGTGFGGYSGDGGPASAAQLASPSAVAVAPDGTIYIADTLNLRVRRIDTSGTITTIVGNGDFERGDGGLATAVRARFATGVSVAPDGTFYFVENLNPNVRRVGPDGLISTLPPAANVTYGTAVDPSGTPYILEADRIEKLVGDALVPVAAGSLNIACAAAWDSDGNMYIADTGNHRIQKVTPGGTVTTFAGTGTSGFSGDLGSAAAAQLSSPRGIAFDATGNAFIADWFNHRIRRVDTDGTITTVAGTGVADYTGDGGPALSATFNQPTSVAVDAAGNVYVADLYNNVVRTFTVGGTIRTLSGDGTAGSAGDGLAASAAQLAAPRTLAVHPGGDLYISTEVDSRIRRIDTSGTIRTVAGAIDPNGMAPLPTGHFADPQALVTDGATTFVAGGATGTIQAILAGTSRIVTVAGRYPSDAPSGNSARVRDSSFGDVGGVAFDAAAGRLYLSETTHHRINVVTLVDPMKPETWTIAPFAGDGSPGSTNGPRLAARFTLPTGLLLDHTAGVLYVADTGGNQIRAISLTTGDVSSVAGTATVPGHGGDGGAAMAAQLYSPRAMTLCPNGDLFVADTGNHRVRRIHAGTITTVIGDGVATSSGIGSPARVFSVDTPSALTCDTRGNLYVASRRTVRLVVADDAGTVDGSGPVQTIFGAPPATRFPEDLTHCISGLTAVDDVTLRLTDSCTGMLIELALVAVP